MRPTIAKKSGQYRLRSAITGAALMALGGAASAVPVEATMDYHCYYEIIGWQPMTVNVTSDIPESVPAGEFTPEFNIEASATVKGQTWTGLASILRASSLEGATAAAAHVGGPNFDFPLNVDMVIPENQVPEADPGEAGFELTGINGVTPPIKFREENMGTMTIDVRDTVNPRDGYTPEELQDLFPEDVSERDLELEVIARRADGSVIVQAPITDSEGVIHAPCVLTPPDQDSVLHEFEVTDGGNGQLPDINVSPEELDFGTVQSGLSATESVTVSNVGGAPLGINSVTLDGDAAFAQTNDCATVDAGDSCTVDITYNASGDASHATTVIINSTDEDEAEVTVAVSGASETQANPDIAVEPAELNFGRVNPGMPSTDTVTVSNSGSAPLTISGINVTGDNADEFMQSNDCTTVAEGDSCAVDITFTPSTTGERGATLTIDSDDPDTGSLSVPLSGEGWTDDGGGTDILMDLEGVSHIKAANGSVPLSGDIDVNVDLSTGLFTADLNLEPTHGDNFDILYLGRLASATADVEFEQVGQTSGQLDTRSGHLSSDSEMYVKLPKVSVKVFGFAIPIGGGENCRTVEPAQIHLESPEGERFDPLGEGGSLEGTYTLPPLENCGAFNDLLSLFMAGEGNTIKMDLTPNL